MKKIYVVFKGRNPGVYDDWNDAKEQVECFEGAVYKGYTNTAEAAEAFRKSMISDDTAQLWRLISGEKKNNKEEREIMDYRSNPEIDQDAWAVDASCLKNPGVMEYQGVDLKTGEVIFRIGPYEDDTNNIGEFLAIVHAMALMAKKGEYHNIYSDSVSGMSWVRNKKVKSTLKRTQKNGKIFELMERGENWLKMHTFPGKLMKWQTERWGEIPADFGRK